MLKTLKEAHLSSQSRMMGDDVVSSAGSKVTTRISELALILKVMWASKILGQTQKSCIWILFFKSLSDSLNKQQTLEKSKVKDIPVKKLF